MKGGFLKPLCTPDDVYNLAGVTDKNVKKRERSRIERLIEREPIFRWGDDYEQIIRGKEEQAGSQVAHSVAFKSGLISDELHAKAIEKALDTSEFFVGTYPQHVAKWLDRHWAKLATIGGGIVSLLWLMKGEFAHYEDVKDNLSRIHNEGGVVHVLKGRDDRTSLVVSDLHARGIPVRVHSAHTPKIRFYICDGEYFYFVSTPGRIFLGFMGSDPQTLEAIKLLFEREWNKAEEPEYVT
ncbi:MAG: hypothetical protein IH975_03175 [Nitrospinae bacterium]|nr:hypothetical protein [Nitrospinota bacterium]